MRIGHALNFVIVPLVLGSLMPLAGAVGASPDSSGAADSAEPAVHLVTPSRKYARRRDPIIAAAAQRLVALRLATRHDAYAKFWPRDRHWRTPDEKYPRVEIGFHHLKKATHLRLVRRGDTFITYASDDGEHFVETGRRRFDAPETMSVGLYVKSDHTGRPTGLEFKKLRLKGEAFGEHRVVEIGRPGGPTEVSREDGTWRLRTAGYRGARRHYGPGVFAFREHRGDFVLEAAVEVFEGNKGWQAGGLMGRASRKPGSPAVAAFAQPKSTSCGWIMPLDEAVREKQAKPGLLRYVRDLGPHVVHAELVTGKDERQRLVTLPVRYSTFEGLTRSCRELADGIYEGLRRELEIAQDEPAAAASLSGQQRTRIRDAAKRSLKLRPQPSLQAIGEVTKILNEAPTAPGVHYAAAGAASRLTSQAMRGVFDQRGRYLAGPLSHLLMGRALGGAESDRERLDTAWTMLACGYPDRALSELERLEQQARRGEEAKALRLFATRDYRRLPLEELAGASTIRQAAWLWAVQECRRGDLLRKGLERLRGGRRTLALMPVMPFTRLPGVSLGHRTTSVMPAVALRESLGVLLRFESAPKGARRHWARKIAGLLNLSKDGNLETLTGRIEQNLRRPRHVVRMRLTDEQFTGVLDAVAHLRQTYHNRTAQIRPGKEGLRIHALPGHDLIRFQRGLILMALHRRADFLGLIYADRKQATRYCQTVAEGFSIDKPLSAYFRALAHAYAGQHDKSAKALRKFRSSPAYTHPGLVLVLGKRWPGSPYRRHDGIRPIQNPGRGAWEWGIATVAGMVYTKFNWAPATAQLLAQVDRHGPGYYSTMAWQDQKQVRFYQVGMERLPYNARLIERAAQHAESCGRSKMSRRMRKRLMEMQPTEVSRYLSLLRVYQQRGEQERAVATMKRALRRLPPSVGRSNIAARYSNYLRKQGKTAEALKYAKQAARSYSGAGLGALALALEDAGQTRKATKVARAMTRRYPRSVHFLLRLLHKRDAPMDTIEQEIRTYRRAHPQRADRWLGLSAIVRGDPDWLQALYDRGLIEHPPDKQRHYLMLAGLYGRRFERVIAESEKLAKRRDRTAYELIFTYIAARLAERPKTVRAVRDELAQHTDHESVGAVATYLTGEASDPRDVNRLQASKRRYAYTRWVLGAEAEADGDMPQARKYYRGAAASGERGQSRAITQYWLSNQLAGGGE